MTKTKKSGIVMTIFHDRNYGFILGDDDETYFFHRAGVIVPFEGLREGLPVDFTVIPDTKGPDPRVKAVLIAPKKGA